MTTDNEWLLLGKDTLMEDMLGFTLEQLQAEVEAGYVNAQTSKIDDYTIYNYSAGAQYGRRWNEVTMTCRGLILDAEFNIVAKPFRKFFNYGEFPSMVKTLEAPSLTQEKIDGSLGEIYLSKNGYRIATRGSFHSDQAEWATEWLNKTFPHFTQPAGITTLVEIIYPENRIVVDYSGEEKLVLLAAIDNATGADIAPPNIYWWEGPRCAEWNVHDAKAAHELATSDEFSDQEGLVCTWFEEDAPSLRLKIKHPEYVRLHKILTNFSEKALWEALAAGQDYVSLLGAVPDEFFNEVTEMVKDYQDRYTLMDAEIKGFFSSIKYLPRKEFAAEALKTDVASALFSLYDNKDHSRFIWKQLKPEQ